MNILPLDPPHYDGWRTLWNSYLAYYEHVMEESVILNLWDRLVSKTAQVEGFIAKDGEKLVGFVHYLKHENTWHDDAYCYLEDLYVDPDARAKGVGRMLIHAVTEKARAENCQKVYWFTHRKNARAQCLYNQVAEQTDFLRYDIQL